MDQRFVDCEPNKSFFLCTCDMFDGPTSSLPKSSFYFIAIIGVIIEQLRPKFFELILRNCSDSWVFFLPFHLNNAENLVSLFQSVPLSSKIDDYIVMHLYTLAIQICHLICILLLIFHCMQCIFTAHVMKFQSDDIIRDTAIWNV